MISLPEQIKNDLIRILYRLGYLPNREDVRDPINYVYGVIAVDKFSSEKTQRYIDSIDYALSHSELDLQELNKDIDYSSDEIRYFLTHTKNDFIRHIELYGTNQR